MNNTLLRFETVTDALTPVAMVRQEPSELVQQLPELVFSPAYDELDYLDFALITVPTGESVALVRHRGRPQGGTEICVAMSPSQAGSVIQSACDLLDLSPQDLTWIHPQAKVPEYTG